MAGVGVIDNPFNHMLVWNTHSQPHHIHAGGYLVDVLLGFASEFVFMGGRKAVSGFCLDD